MVEAGSPLPHPALADATRTLQHRYKVQFDGFGMMQYRDGRDGQAFHRDTDMKWLDDTVIAMLTLGAQRPWLLRPRASRYDHTPGRGATHDLAPASGDLLVMGGRTPGGLGALGALPRASTGRPAHLDPVALRPANRPAVRRAARTATP